MRKSGFSNSQEQSNSYLQREGKPLWSSLALCLLGSIVQEYSLATLTFRNSNAIHGIYLFKPILIEMDVMIEMNHL
jgi:hypothetical protein